MAVGWRGWDWAQPLRELGDSRALISVPPAGTSFTPFSALGSLLILLQEGLAGAVVFPLETSEPGSAASSLWGQEGDSGILQGPQ